TLLLRNLMMSASTGGGGGGGGGGGILSSADSADDDDDDDDDNGRVLGEMIEIDDDDDDDDDDDSTLSDVDVVRAILGAATSTNQVSSIPFGGVAAGGGGTAPNQGSGLPSPLAMATLLAGFGIAINHKRAKSFYSQLIS